MSNSFIDQFKDKSVFHISDKDTDGVSCICIVEIYIEPLCSVYLPYMNSDRTFSDQYIYDNIENFDIILFTDIAPTLDLLNYIKNLNKTIIICDHHDTSYEVLKDENIEQYYYTIEDCGAKILFDKIFENSRPPKAVKEYVELVSIYDTWKKNNPLWQQANDVMDLHMGSVNYSVDDSYKANYKYIKNMKLKLKFNSNFYFTNSDKKIIQERKRKREEAYKKCLKTLEKRIDNQGLKYIYCELPTSISNIGNRLVEENSEYSYVAIYNSYYKIKDLMKISLRSIDYKVNNIAEIYGGGGHPFSASFLFNDIEQFEKFRKGEVHLQ